MKSFFSYTLISAFSIICFSCSTAKKEPLNDEIIYETVDTMPQPTDGIQTFFSYIMDNLKYPEKAKIMGIEGKVFVEFVVNKDGSISDVQIIKGIGAGCDQEAKRVVSESKNWIPGEKDGSPVNVKLTLPITFKLS